MVKLHRERAVFPWCVGDEDMWREIQM